MKTEMLPLLPFRNYPLKVIEAKEKKKAWLRVVKKEALKNYRFSFIENSSIHDPENWDEYWFANYE